MHELTDRLDCTHTLIAKIEGCERRVDLVEPEAILDALGISLVEFERRYRRA